MKFKKPFGIFVLITRTRKDSDPFRLRFTGYIHRRKPALERPDHLAIPEIPLVDTDETWPF